MLGFFCFVLCKELPWSEFGGCLPHSVWLLMSLLSYFFFVFILFLACLSRSHPCVYTALLKHIPKLRRVGKIYLEKY